MLCFIGDNWPLLAQSFEIGDVLVIWPRAARRRLVEPGPYSPATIAQVAARLDQRLRPAS
jgi:hypothetical protein